MTEHAPFLGGGVVTESQDFMRSTCVQNLTILASAVPDISLGR